MYLLLRNNKQSGPYSLEELKSMGLKAYDLVWLEGKSAAWRYPSEIEELKAFAPAVEEQPFDRFYRKPAPTTTTATMPGSGAIPVTVESSKAPGKRIIYVTMPAAKSPSGMPVSRTIVQPVREAVQPAREVVQPTREAIQQVREAAQSIREAIQPTGETFEPAREYAQPVREPLQAASESLQFVREPLQPVREAIEDYTAHASGDKALIGEFFPRRKSARPVVRLLTVALCILALLAAGIIIGLNLNKATLGFPARVVAKVPAEQAIVHPTAQSLPAPAMTPVTGPARPADTVPNIVEQAKVTSPAVARAATRTSGVRAPKEKVARPASRASSLSVKDSAAQSEVANAVHRAAIAEPYHSNTELADKEAIKAALASQVSVGANGYSVGTFGGITGLQLTVTNRSAYPLDLVIVEVQYIQANKKIFKTENLFFRGIGAGSALMQEAPKSSRGVRVQYKIMSITSKEVAYSYSGI